MRTFHLTPQVAIERAEVGVGELAEAGPGHRGFRNARAAEAESFDEVILAPAADSLLRVGGDVAADNTARELAAAGVELVLHGTAPFQRRMAQRATTQGRKILAVGHLSGLGGARKAAHERTDDEIHLAARDRI